MVFKIILENEINKKEKIIYYDNTNNELTDHQNKRIEIPNYIHIPLLNKSKKRLTIQLGFSCNMSCSYCLQSKTTKSKFNKEDCDDLIEKILKLDLTNTRLEFWGGEPLLYFKEIVYIVRKLNSKKHLPSDFLMITNGVLLTIRIVKFLTKMNFNMAVSHDAQSQDIRGKNPFEIPSSLEAIKYLHQNFRNRYSINSVITKDNINTEDRLKYFSKYLEVENILEIPHGGEGIVYNVDNIILDTKDLSSLIQNDIINGLGLQYSSHKNIVNSFIKNIVKNTTIDNITTKCGIEKDNYKILDLNKKTLTCHNFNFEFKPLSIMERVNCKDCLLVQLCKGGCPAIKNEDPIFKKNCETFFNYNLPFFKLVIKILIPGHRFKKYEEYII